MESFYELLCSMEKSPLVTDSRDLIRKLSLKIAYKIFRMLDDRSLYSASEAHPGWEKMIKSDKKLRIRLRRHIKIARMDKLNQKHLETVDSLDRYKPAKVKFSGKSFSLPERSAKRIRFDNSYKFNIK